MIGHGHIGDGNLHLNCTIKGCTDSARKLQKKLAHILEPYVFSYVKRHRGSVSAEHGIGL